VLLAAAGSGRARRPGPPARAGAFSTEQQRSRGAYLALAGDCMACHTRGGAQYAGGRLLATPFGSLHTPNITPDRQYGIGNWSADDFWRALHNGVSKDGRLLYPAFPYTNYTRMPREDSDALYVYLQSLPAVNRASLPHQLRFPYNQQLMLAGWRALYFRPGVFRPDAGKAVEWNRGAYQVRHIAAPAIARATGWAPAMVKRWPAV
jgi:mono/diheme cytochrome c family protein